MRLGARARSQHTRGQRGGYHSGREHSGYHHTEHYAGPRHNGQNARPLRVVLQDLVQSSPSRFALSVFSGLIILWTALLSLPISNAQGVVTPLADAFFTAVSAVCVTGLATVDMATYWTPFGDVVILAGFQIGGIGVLTVASMLAVTVTRRLGLRERLLAATDQNPARTTKGASENQAVGLGDMGGLLVAVLTSLVVIEGALTLLLLPRMFAAGYDLWHSLWYSFYLAASSFTNTGFVPMPGGLEPYKNSPYLLTVLAVGVFLGSIGFPVIFSLWRYLKVRRYRRHHRINLHAKLTLFTTIALVIAGWVFITAFEFNNQKTLGQQDLLHTLMNAGYMSVMTRSGGLGIMDPNDMNGSTMLIMDMLMFVGGGSASTAGGIKVTTIAVLFLAAWAEARGDRDIQVFERRIPDEMLRLAVSIFLWGATIVAAATLTIMQLTKVSLDNVLFEVISAFGTCGLSTGLSAELPDAGKYVLALTMLAGRVGTVTLAAAIAASTRRRRYRLPEERPIVG